MRRSSSSAPAPRPALTGSARRALRVQARFRASTCWLLLIAAVGWIYVPGLHGWFVFDDIPNIVENGALHIDDLSWASLRRAAMSGVASDWGRPLSMLSFGANYALTAGDAFAFKLV